MNHKQITAAAAAAALVALTCTAGGCGSSSGGSSGAGGAGGLNCQFNTFLNSPVKKQITATSSVFCDFTPVTARTTLVIQGRKTGAGASAWDNFDDPKASNGIPMPDLTYTVTCIGGYDYQASADITGVGPQGQPFHSHETTPVTSYTAADCAQS